MTSLLDYSPVDVENGLPPQFPPDEEDMAPPTLTQRMEAVERALGLSKDAPSKWYKNPVVVVSAILIPIFGIAMTYYETVLRPDWDAQLTTKIDTEIDKKFAEHHFDQLVSDVSKMEGQLTEISSFVKIIAANQMQHSASLTPQEFRKSLPALAATLGVAKTTGVSVSPDVVHGIQSKLAQTGHDEPAFWGAASALVDYRFPAKPSPLPSCLKEPPVQRLLESLAPQQTGPVKTSPPLYENCEIDLDSSIPPGILDVPIARGNRLDFFNCRVVYRGNPIPLFTRYPMLTFTNCTFDLSVSAPPVDKGKQLVQSLLLASDMSHVSVGGSGT